MFTKGVRMAEVMRQNPNLFLFVIFLGMCLFWMNCAEEPLEEPAKGDSNIQGNPGTVDLNTDDAEILWEKDGAWMVPIPAGEFRMGDAFNEGHPSELPVHTVYLDAFYMDVYEVTNAQYERFINETGHPKPPYWAAGLSAPKKPVVSLSWNAAMAYAEWAGKRLPTEAEWEKAARGGLIGRKYPWGDEEPDDKRANYGGDVGETTEVGQYDKNGYGLYDMAGNVWEICLDEYQSDFYTKSPLRNPIAGFDGIQQAIFIGSKGIADPSRHGAVLRGGGWSTSELRVAARGELSQFDLFGVTGFRCVVNP